MVVLIFLFLTMLTFVGVIAFAIGGTVASNITGRSSGVVFLLGGIVAVGLLWAACSNL